MTSRLFVAVHSIALLTLLTLTCLTPHSNDMTSWQNSSSKDLVQRRAILLSSPCGVQHLVSDTLYQTGYFL